MERSGRKKEHSQHFEILNSDDVWIGYLLKCRSRIRVDYPCSFCRIEGLVWRIQRSRSYETSHHSIVIIDVL
jgi:hypothetical protein